MLSTLPKPPLTPKNKRAIAKNSAAYAESTKAVTSQLPANWTEFASLTKIKSAGQVVPFVPYDFQDELIRTIEANQYTCIIKSRQLGISETICSWLLMRALTEPGFTAVVISKTQKDSSDLSDRVKRMANSLGDKCPVFESESKTKLAWVGLGSIEFLASTPRAARSIPSVSVLLLDEAGFIDKIDQIYQAASPTLAMVGEKAKVVMCSTPNGKQGLFWEILGSEGEDSDRIIRECQAIRQSNSIVPFDRLSHHTRFLRCGDWAKVLLHWRSHPIYGVDPDWATKQRVKLRLTQRQWNIEYELELAESGSLVFDSDLIDVAAKGCWVSPLSRNYLAGIDPNFGGDDFFVTQVWDVTDLPYQLVAEYRNNRRSKDYNLAQTLKLLDDYNPAVTSCETNGGGSLILEELTKLRSHLTILGVATTATSKICHTDRIGLLLERNALVFPQECSFNQEAKHFVETTNGKTRSRAAESGYHDDGVMAAAIAFANLDRAIAANWMDVLMSLD